VGSGRIWHELLFLESKHQNKAIGSINELTATMPYEKK